MRQAPAERGGLFSTLDTVTFEFWKLISSLIRSRRRRLAGAGFHFGTGIGSPWIQGPCLGRRAVVGRRGHLYVTAESDPACPFLGWEGVSLSLFFISVLFNHALCLPSYA